MTKEKEFISTIKRIIGSKYIGDDCAYLKDLGITITQDSLTEDIHFRRKYITPYQLGYKSIMVNLSDIASSGAKPKYITISVSLPKDIDDKFIEEFYLGAQKACKDDIEIIGGDITGSDKIYISICAIGLTTDRNISSRKDASTGQKVIISGPSGSSAAGLRLLEQQKNSPEELINSHLMPQAQLEFGKNIAKSVKTPYAMMDTSDGLMETLSTIANESKVLLEIDFDKIPYDKDIEMFSDWKDLVLFGGEDYQIVACVPQNYPYGIKIGEVKNGLGVNLKLDEQIIHFNQENVDLKVYNHFGEN